MATRKELPWNDINAETISATKAFAKTEFVSTKQLADYVIEHSYLYPLLTSTRKCTTSRLTMSMRKMNWKCWSSLGSGKQKVFVVPGGI